MKNDVTNVDENYTNKMWEKSCLLMRVVASAVKVSEAAGNVIKNIMLAGNLKTFNKAVNGKTDLQTEADRMAQFVIEKSLQEKFNYKLKIIGEEDITTPVNIRELNVSLDVLSYDYKCNEELRLINIEDLVVWVDPLDGTSEFVQATQTNRELLEQVTVLIGIAYKGKALAGIIHQPYYNKNGRTVWGIKGIGTFGIKLLENKKSNEKIVVTSRSHSNKVVEETLEALKKNNLLTKIDRVAGAGYKTLRCLDDAAAYVFASKGCKKWDTAGPEAVLEAAGGKLTDISGRTIYYGADAQLSNTGGVLATASWIKHQDYLESIPKEIKYNLPEKLS